MEKKSKNFTQSHLGTKKHNSGFPCRKKGALSVRRHCEAPVLRVRRFAISARRGETGRGEQAILELAACVSHADSRVTQVGLTRQ